MKAHEEIVAWRMITLQIHAKAESRQSGPLFIMFSGPRRMFHQTEKYDSGFTDTLSGFNAALCVFVCLTNVFISLPVLLKNNSHNWHQNIVLMIKSFV